MDAEDLVEGKKYNHELKGYVYFLGYDCSTYDFEIENWSTEGSLLCLHYNEVKDLITEVEGE